MSGGRSGEWACRKTHTGGEMRRCRWPVPCCTAHTLPPVPALSVSAKGASLPSISGSPGLRNKVACQQPREDAQRSLRLRCSPYVGHAFEGRADEPTWQRLCAHKKGHSSAAARWTTYSASVRREAVTCHQGQGDDVTRSSKPALFGLTNQAWGFPGGLAVGPLHGLA